MYVNLLPVSFVRHVALRRQMWRWCVVVGLVLASGGGFVVAEYCAVVTARRTQSVTAFRSKELHAVKADTGRLLAEAKTIGSEISTLEKARPEDRTLALLGIASTSAQKCVGKVHLKNLATQLAAAATPQAAAPPIGLPGKKPAPTATGGETPNDLMLEGTAEDAASIASFIEALRETGVFLRVDLTATNEAAGSGGAARQFRVDCKF